MGVTFKDFFLSANSELFIYSGDRKVVTGPVTASENMGSTRTWSSNSFQTNEIIIELRSPRTELLENRLHISSVRVGKRVKIETNLDSLNFGNFNASNPCNINVVCAQATAWGGESKAVCLIETTSGALGSGALMINTCNTNRPFLLTAWHVIDGYTPVVHPSSFIHPQAAVTGNVVIGKNCYIGPGAAIRGDWGGIVIEDGCNVQENCTIHMFPGITVLLKKGAHIGHGAVVHGAVIGKNCLVGMNAVIMDNVILGNECIVGALSFVKGGEQFSRRSLIAGNPAQVIKKVSDEMMAWKTEGTKLYQQLPEQCHNTLIATKALKRKPVGKKQQPASYQPWKRGQWEKRD